MSRDIDADLLSSLSETHVYPAVMAEFNFDSGAVGVWTGIGTLEWDGRTFTGLGNLVGMSPVTETQDLIANNLTFMLNGIEPALIALALDEDLQGRSCSVWLGTVTSTSRLASEDDTGGITLEDGSDIIFESSTQDTPYQIFSGTMDMIEGKISGALSEIRLSAENWLIIAKSPREERYTDADQQQKYPGDKFFEFTPQLQDKEVTW